MTPTIQSTRLSHSHVVCSLQHPVSNDRVLSFLEPMDAPQVLDQPVRGRSVPGTLAKQQGRRLDTANSHHVGSAIVGLSPEGVGVRYPKELSACQ